MPSQQLSDIIAMLRATASERGEAELTMQEWREAYVGLASLIPVNAAVTVRPVDLGGVPGEQFVCGEGPVILYLHGGGYCIGSVATHRPMLTHLAAAVGGRVFAVDYRLAPEHPYPAALDDAMTAYRYVLGSVNPEDRVVVAGDSAGGGLALSTLVAIRDGGDPPPAAGVLISPWTDLTQSGATMTANAHLDPMVRRADLDRWADLYRGRSTPDDPAISPLFADLHDLPPLLIEVGTAEVLLDDARRTADAARLAGVAATLHEDAEMIHVWHFFAGIVPEADAGIVRIARFISACAT